MDVGNGIKKDIGKWSFHENVASNFVEHAQNSIINYVEGHELICKLSMFFCKKNSVCYDLGTSTGELLKKLAENSSTELRLIGIDESTEMINKAKENIRGFSNIEFINDDILNVDFEKSDLIISYYTIQFIHPKNRQKLLNKIYESLNEGSAFVMFEKVYCDNSKLQEIFSSLYTEFKIKNDFSAEEIIGKTRSLYGVLRPNTSNDNIKQLKLSGFTNVAIIMKNLCFEGYLAIK